ncbi:hypothetical protein IMZ48_19090 [Candidatus Bathyarchaeota archaeon]|nr:hypothetical protein [Candidatus Bathyarchaeota archaeon]
MMKINGKWWWLEKKKRKRCWGKRRWRERGGRGNAFCREGFGRQAGVNDVHGTGKSKGNAI